ncbi:hypothetical protein [Xanthomonas arboricola]|uniref:Uncharacterized protein n=1 Tax=Xanthomonas arboricola TaxID=56448 RepID=A0AB73H2R8_9XANT|nr:hypothetical protein [Xanthomonas arboricola]MBB5672471.1 hypothetical protein [Xanthomonas arboricola]
MLDLDAEVVMQHWHQAAPGLAELLVRIELTEDWTVDRSPVFADKIVQFGKSLSRPGAVGALQAADRLQLLFFLVYISTSKAVRLLQWLDDEHDGLGSILLNHLLSSEGDAQIRAGIRSEQLVRTLLHRMRILQNQPYFRSVFDPQKLNRVAQAIRQQSEESQNA